LLIVDKIDKI